ncbi:MAG: biotin/lipoyl-binding protein [Planctomycetaceae bacterium]
MQTVLRGSVNHRRSGRSRWTILAVLAAIVCAGAWGGWQLWGSTGESEQTSRGILTHAVARGDMLVTVTDDGTLQSAKNIDVKCEVAGGGTILWLVQDGKQVEAGEKLVELDPAAIEEQLNLQKSVFEKARATKIQAEQNLAAADVCGASTRKARI